MGRAVATALNRVPLNCQTPKMAEIPTHQAAFLALRILATSDLHANILAWDYHANRVCIARGLTRVATLIARARAEAPNCLLFDNGDFLNGNALGDHLAQTLHMPANAARVHPMISAMNHLGYDAATLGNHEFSHGLGPLTRALRDANFPIVASNLTLTGARPAPVTTRSLLLRRDLIDTAGCPQNLTIGVIGVLPPQTVIWEHRHLKDCALVADILETTRNLVAGLRASGADLVIALSHSGIGSGEPEPFGENVSQALAALEGIDVVIAGHTHLVFPSAHVCDLAGKPVVMPGFFGSHLGVIDLTLQKSSDQGPVVRWKIASHHVETRPIAMRSSDGSDTVALVDDDPMISTLVAHDQAALLDWSEKTIGHSPKTLHSFFALLTQSPALDLVATVQSQHLVAALAGGPYADLPVLSAVAPFKAGGRGGPENYTYIPEGPLLRRNVADLYLHPNSLVGLCLPAQAVVQWLERSVSMFHQISPGSQDAMLINPDFPSYDFDVFYGLTYLVDLSQPARFDRRGTEVAPQARRIVNPCYLGEPLRRDQLFVVATNSYRCAGGSGFARPGPGQIVFEAKRSTQTLIEDFLCGTSQTKHNAAAFWGFAAQTGTTVLFECDPRAILATGDVPQLRLEPLARLPNGFHRFRLHL